MPLGELIGDIRRGCRDFPRAADVVHRRLAAAQTLNKLCAIDLSDRVTPDGTAFRSSVAKLATDVVRDDFDGTRSYLLHCERSSGQYLFDVLLDAGREFGIEPDGFAYPEA